MSQHHSIGLSCSGALVDGAVGKLGGVWSSLAASPGRIRLGETACLVVRPFLAAAVVTAGSFVAAAPDALAQCRNGWCKVGCSDSGCYYVRVIDRDYPIYKVEESGPDRTKIVYFDCQQYKWKNEGWDSWTQMMPGSIGEAVIETACKM